MLDWNELLRRQQAPTPTHAPVVPLDPARASKYAQAAIEREVAAVAGAPQGVRNDTLNRAGFSLAQLVAAGHAKAEDVRARLANAARHAGLPESEIAATLASSLGAGAQFPRVVADLPPLPEPTTLLMPTNGAQAGRVRANGVAGGQDTTGTPGGAQDGSGDATGAHIATTWAPVDLAPYLDGTHEPEVPALLRRSDERALLYPGRVHSLHGESESGKSLVAQVEAVRQVKAGSAVLYVDFESDAAAIVGRLMELGAEPDAVARHFTYLRPETDPRRFVHEAEALGEVVAQRYALAVIDGVTDALGVFGFKSGDNDDLSAFMRSLPRLLASRTGGAVVLIDHVTKNADTRGRFAIGGQAKMAALDGAAYVVEVDEALGRGLRGAISLRIAKDRPGGIRPHCGAFRKLDRTQEAAHIVVDSTADIERIEVAILPPRTGTTPGTPGEFRPTRTMQRVYDYVAEAGEPQTRLAIETAELGKRATVRKALHLLVAEGYLRSQVGPHNATLHTVTGTPYVESQDPDADTYVPSFNEGDSGHEIPSNSASSPVRRSSPQFAGARSSQFASSPVTPKGYRRASELDNGTTGEASSPDPYAHAEPCTRCQEPVTPAVAEVTGGRCRSCFASDEGEAGR